MFRSLRTPAQSSPPGPWCEHGRRLGDGAPGELGQVAGGEKRRGCSLLALTLSCAGLQMDRPAILRENAEGHLILPGNEWTVIQLGVPGTVDEIEVDTIHFKVSLEAGRWMED